MTMIISLFENFDPLMRTFHLNFIILLIPFIIPLNQFNLFFSKPRHFIVIDLVNNYIFEELKASLNNFNHKIKLIILVTLFFLILLLNILGLLPYIYTLTRQLIFTLRIALPFWTRLLIFNIIKNTNHFFRHLVPLSTPLLLSQFITIIESISQLIRPITLSVRLCANITAGHILIALVRKPIFILNPYSLLLLILISLEIAVAFIQSYVFVILLSIYIRETR